MPLLAVAEILRRDPRIKLQFIGTAEGPEVDLAHAAGIPFTAIPAGKLRRYLTLESVVLNVRDLARLARGVFVARRLVLKRRPAIIFTKGGPVALPAAVAAWWTKTPLVIHESDAVMGVANRIVAGVAKQVFTAFPASVYPPSLAKKIIPVGVPLRRDFGRQSRVPKSRRPMVLITGGSQGAAAINRAIGAILPRLLNRVAVMHITGAASYPTMLRLKEELPPRLAEHYGVVDFASNIADYMREATLVVSRASSTIFEIATLGKPMILIPLPSSANDHQVRNAEIFVENRAALMLRQENLTPERLYETISELLGDSVLRRQLEEGTRVFGSRGAAQEVASSLKRTILMV